MSDKSTVDIEFRRVDKLRYNFTHSETFYCPSINTKLADYVLIAYDINDPHVFRQNNRAWYKYTRARLSHKHELARIIDVRVITLLTHSYDKLIKDEQTAAIYKVETINLLVKINLISECFIPDIITHMKTLI